MYSRESNLLVYLGVNAGTAPLFKHENFRTNELLNTVYSSTVQCRELYCLLHIFQRIRFSRIR